MQPLFQISNNQWIQLALIISEAEKNNLRVQESITTKIMLKNPKIKLNDEQWKNLRNQTWEKEQFLDLFQLVDLKCNMKIIDHRQEILQTD